MKRAKKSSTNRKAGRRSRSVRIPGLDTGAVPFEAILTPAPVAAPVLIVGGEGKGELTPARRLAILAEIAERGSTTDRLRAVLAYGELEAQLQVSQGAGRKSLFTVRAEPELPAEPAGDETPTR